MNYGDEIGEMRKLAYQLAKEHVEKLPLEDLKRQVTITLTERIFQLFEGNPRLNFYSAFFIQSLGTFEEEKAKAEAKATEESEILDIKF